MKAALRSLALTAVLSVLAACFPPTVVTPAAEPIDVAASPVALDTAQPERTRIGRLSLVGALVLRSGDARFGGFSAIDIAEDGGALVALSDRGYRMTARLRTDARGAPVALEGAEIVSLRGVDGRPLAAARARDAEGIAPAADGVVVTFEHDHRLVLYPDDGGSPVRLAAPAGLAAAPENGGLEAITRLADGRLFALTESLAAADGVVGWVGGPGAWGRLVWRTDGGFEPTGAATLPGGDVVVLERRFPPIGARIRRIAASAIQPGAVLDGDYVAGWMEPLTVDNVEGIDAIARPDGTTHIVVVSDDNYNLAQRTILMVFELTE